MLNTEPKGRNGPPGEPDQARPAVVSVARRTCPGAAVPLARSLARRPSPARPFACFAYSVVRIFSGHVLQFPGWAGSFENIVRAMVMPMRIIWSWLVWKLAKALIWFGERIPWARS